MTVLYIILAMVSLGVFNYYLAQSHDKRELGRLQCYLLTGQKNESRALIYRITGYGGGWIEFADKCFNFFDDNGLFSADDLISNDWFYKVACRESW